MKRVFFITGLPRSRTAWLANLLTHGPSFCYHEACRQLEHIDQLPQLFQDAGSPNVGTADCGFPYYYDQALALFPEAQIVVIQRPAADCRASYERVLKQIELDLPQLRTAAFHQILEDFDAMRRALSNRHVLEVDYQRLDQPLFVQSIWNHCTRGAPFDQRRLAMLKDLQVQVIPSRVAAAVNLEHLRHVFSPPPAGEGRVRAPLPVHSSAQTPLMAEYNQMLNNLCAQTPGAYQWLQQLWEILLTWDHIVDGDVIDRDMASRAFEALMFSWPQNPFFQAHKDRLITVMINAVSAWSHENHKTHESHVTVKDTDMYTEVPCAVAAILGGTALVGRVMPRLRELNELMRAQNQKEKLW